MRRIAAVVALAVLAGCSGPPDPLDVAVKEVPSDIVLGSAESGAPAPAPVPPAIPVLTGPGVPPSLFDPSTPTPSPTGPPASPPTGDPCPKADPLVAPRREAMNRITAPPPVGPLPYRVDGTFSVSGANPRNGRFPTTSTRIVGAVATTADGFTYEVAAELAGTTTTTGYEVVEQSQVPGDAALYVTFVATRAPSGATARFQPALPLKIVELPIVRGATFTTAGTDPASQVAVSWRSTVATKTRVDACGTPLDAYRVQLTEGQAVGAALNETFTATYDIGTQFGGLLLADQVTVQGTEGDDDVSRRITSTISTEPGGRG